MTELEYANKKYVRCFLRRYSDLKAISEHKSDYELLNKILDIELAIKNSGLSKRTIKIINLYTQGFYEREIAKEMGVTQQAINLTINNACSTISKYLTKCKINQLGELK